MKRNIQAAALSRRAGNAGCAVGVDTRPKIVRPQKGKGSYQRQKLHARDC